MQNNQNQNNRTPSPIPNDGTGGLPASPRGDGTGGLPEDREYSQRYSSPIAISTQEMAEGCKAEENFFRKRGRPEESNGQNGGMNNLEGGSGSRVSRPRFFNDGDQDFVGVRGNQAIAQQIAAQAPLHEILANNANQPQNLPPQQDPNILPDGVQMADNIRPAPINRGNGPAYAPPLHNQGRVARPSVTNDSQQDYFERRFITLQPLTMQQQITQLQVETLQTQEGLQRAQQASQRAQQASQQAQQAAQEAQQLVMQINQNFRNMQITLASARNSAIDARMERDGAQEIAIQQFFNQQRASTDELNPEVTGGRRSPPDNNPQIMDTRGDRPGNQPKGSGGRSQ
jgi:hypothetical protein